MRQGQALSRVEHQSPRVLKLPEIGEQNAPGWRVIRHSVGATVGIFFTALAGSLIVAVFVAMRVTIDGDGVVEPLRVWPLRSLESGIVSEVLVRTGDTVRAGQIIARFDTLAASAVVRETRAQLGAARAEAMRLEQANPIDSARARMSIAQQEARVVSARTTLRDRMSLFSVTGDLDSIVRAAAGRTYIALDGPAADYAAAQAGAGIARSDLRALGLGVFKLEQQRAEVQRLETELATSRERLARQTIRAPTDGVILTDEVERIVGSAVAPGQTILEIAASSQWHAVLQVSERDIHRVRLGDRASIELPALSMMAVDQLPGLVTFVGWQATSSQSGVPSSSAGGYRVTVTLDSSAIAALPPHTLRRGYAARGKIVTKTARAIQVLFENLRDRMRGVTSD